MCLAYRLRTCCHLLSLLAALHVSPSHEPRTMVISRRSSSAFLPALCPTISPSQCSDHSPTHCSETRAGCFFPIRLKKLSFCPICRCLREAPCRCSGITRSHTHAFTHVHTIHIQWPIRRYSRVIPETDGPHSVECSPGSSSLAHTVTMESACLALIFVLVPVTLLMVSALSFQVLQGAQLIAVASSDPTAAGVDGSSLQGSDIQVQYVQLAPVTDHTTAAQVSPASVCEQVLGLLWV